MPDQDADAPNDCPKKQELPKRHLPGHSQAGIGENKNSEQEQLKPIRTPVSMPTLTSVIRLCSPSAKQADEQPDDA
jgi:hypothetical protein